MLTLIFTNFFQETKFNQRSKPSIETTNTNYDLTKQTWRADNPSGSKVDNCCSKSDVQEANDDDNLFEAKDEMESIDDDDDDIIEA